VDEVVRGIHAVHRRRDRLRLQCIAFHYVYLIAPGLGAEALGVAHETADRVPFAEKTGDEATAHVSSGARDENSGGGRRGHAVRRFALREKSRWSTTGGGGGLLSVGGEVGEKIGAERALREYPIARKTVTATLTSHFTAHHFRKVEESSVANIRCYLHRRTFRNHG
jgi:hypothetical protein